MDLHLTVDLKKTKTLIDLADQAHLIIEQTTKLPKKEAAILFLLRDNQLVALGLAEEKATYKEVSFDHSILLKPTWDTELAYLAQAFLDDAKESGLTLEATPATVKIPKSAVATVTNYKETVTFILEHATNGQKKLAKFLFILILDKAKQLFFGKSAMKCLLKLARQ